MSRRAIIAGLLLILVGSGAVFFTARLLSTEKVLYQEADDIGPDPFTDPAIFTSDVAPPTTTTSTTTTTLAPSPNPSASASPAAAAPTTIPFFEEVPGETPPVSYGSKGDCDPEKLIAFLNENPEVEQAWVEVLGVDLDDFENYVRSLQPTKLDRDTRVTSHGFRDGKAYAYQAILTEGTAVLVDPNGEIVTRCICGNPLIEPRQIKYKCDGCPDDYQPPPPCEQTCYAPPTTSTTTTTFPPTTTALSGSTTTTRRSGAGTTARSGTGGTATTSRSGTGGGGTTRPGGAVTTRPGGAVTTAPPATTAPVPTTQPQTTTTGLCILPGLCLPN